MNGARFMKSGARFLKNGARFLKNGARAAGAFALSLCLVPVPVRGQEEADTSACLPLPAVPASLRAPAERAGYIVRHFWDSMDFADVRRTRDSGFMERNFTNYLSLFPVADASVLAPAVDSIVARVRADGKSLSVLCGLAGKYLYEQDSPAYDEEYYLLFADSFMKTPLPGRERARLLAQREAALKNRVGAPAADFSYETPAGERARMSETGRGKPLLLLFYDPDCGHCWEVMEQLRSMEPLCRAGGAGNWKCWRCTRATTTGRRGGRRWTDCRRAGRRATTTARYIRRTCMCRAGCRRYTCWTGNAAWSPRIRRRRDFPG